MELGRLALHRIYVPDFLDASGQRSGTGAYFAATFAKLLSAQTKSFTIINRADVHNVLDQNGWTDQDLSVPDVLTKLTSTFTPDVVLWGTISRSNDKILIDFIARELSGKELFRFPYQEKADPLIGGMLPPGTNSSGRIFYFAGLDGVTEPKCISCPSPHYSPEERQERVAGTVHLSALITTEGKTDQVRLVTKLSPGLDNNTLEVMKSWNMAPARGPDGAPVPVRVAIDVAFKIYP